MDISVSLNLISIMISLFFYIVIKGKAKGATRIYNTYYTLVLGNFLTGAMGIFLILYIMLVKAGFFVQENNSIHSIITFIYLIYSIILLSLCSLLTLFIFQLAGIDVKYNLKIKGLIFLPLLVISILMIISAYTGFMYKFDDNFDYSRSNYYFLIYVFIIYNSLLWLILRFRNSNRFGKKECSYINLFVICGLTTSVIHYLVGYDAIYSFEISILLIVVIYSLKTPEQIFDPSDAMLREELFNDVEQSINNKKDFSVIFVRILDISLLEETYGKSETDIFLRTVTSFFKELDKDVSVYRLDSGTFAIKLNIGDSLRIFGIRKTILTRFQEEFHTSFYSHKLKAGLVYIDNSNNIDSVKSFRNNCHSIINANIMAGSDLNINDILLKDNEQDIINAVKKALGNKTFRVFYQPIYSTEKKKIVAAEALIRLFDDKLGFISPEIFIPLAEREGYILKIGHFVFTEVCKYYSENNLFEKGIEYIEVNLSPVQCMQYKLAEEFLNIMKIYDLKPDQINFEITESSAVINNSAFSLNIDCFVNNGVELSLDDYGTGYSNISYLYHMPFSIMKVDKSLLWSADKNKKANITLENIFSMAKDLKMRIVVEGVETEEQIRKLRKLRCDYFQGYYFSKPVNERDFINYIDNFQIPSVCIESI